MWGEDGSVRGGLGADDQHYCRCGTPPSPDITPCMLHAGPPPHQYEVSLGFHVECQDAALVEAVPLQLLVLCLPVVGKHRAEGCCDQPVL